MFNSLKKYISIFIIICILFTQSIAFANLDKNISGKNLTVGETIVFDESESYDEENGSVKVKYWAPFCRVDFENAFSEYEILPNDEYNISAYIKVSESSAMETGTVYFAVLDKDKNFVYNYEDSQAFNRVFAKKGEWLKLEMNYRVVNGTKPYSIALVGSSDARTSNMFEVNVDAFSVVQTKKGAKVAEEKLSDYLAIYDFDSESNVPAYVTSQHIKGTNIALDADVNNPSGKKGKSLKARFWAQYTSLSIASLFEKTTLKAGDKCTVAFWAKLNDAAEHDMAKFYISVYDKDKNVIYTGSANATEVTKGGWTKIKVNLDLAEGKMPSIININTQTLENGSPLWVNIDNIVIENQGGVTLSGNYGEYTDDLSLLASLGICTDFISKFSPDNTLSRIDFARMIASLYNTKISSGSISFQDTAESDAASLGILVDQKIISDADKFRPDDIITYNEVIKMMVSYLGYDYYAQNTGGYPTGYIMAAQRIDLLDGITVSDANKLTQADGLKFMINLLNATKATITEITDGNVIYSKDDNSSVVYDSFDTVKAEGVVYSSDYTSEKYSVTIGDTTYKCSSDFRDYIGYNAEFYYNEETMEIVYLSIPDEFNKVLKITSDNEPYYESSAVYYTDENGRDKTIKIPFDARIYYNYQKVESISSKHFDISSGSITAIDNDYDGKYDVIDVKDIEHYVVKRYDSENKIIYTKYADKSFKVDEDALLITDTDGNKVNASSLDEFDVAGIYVPQNEGDKITRIVLSENAADVVVEELGFDYESYFTSEGETFRYTNECKELIQNGILSDVNISDKLTVYLSADNKVAGYEASNTMKIGYLIEAFRDYETKDKTINLKMLTSDNKIIDVTFDKEVDFNNSLNCDPEKDTAFDIILEGGKRSNGIVLYKLNSDNKITEMKTMSDSDAFVEDEISTVTTNGGGAYRSGGYFGKYKYIVHSDTVVFRVPQDKTLDENYYAAFTKDYFSSGTQYSFKAYTVNGTSNICDIIVMDNANVSRSAKTIGSSASVMLINSVGTGVTKSGDECIVLKGLMSGKETSVKIIDDRKVKSPAFAKGDIIMYSADSNGEVEVIDNGKGTTSNENFRYLLDIDGDAGKPKTITSVSINTSSAFTGIYTPYSYKNGYLWCNNTTDKANTDAQAAFDVSAAEVYKYDTKNKEYISSDIGVVNDYLTVGDNANTIFAQVKSERLAVIVILD